MAERLTPLDAAFLGFERRGAPMHVGGLLLLDGEPADGGQPDPAAVLRHLRRRLARVPRIPQRIVAVPFGAHRPVWVDDPHYDPRRHLRRARLAAPGSRRQLLQAVRRLHAEVLPRDRPLWQVTLFEGLDDGTLAIYAKLHHSMVDGLAAVALALTVFDMDPEAGPEAHESQPPSAAPLPDPQEMVTEALREQRDVAMQGMRDGARTLSSALPALRRALEFQPAGALGRLLDSVRPAPRSPLTVTVGERRLVELLNVPLAVAKEVKDELGLTINDVVLAAVAEGLHTFLRGRGPVRPGATHRVAVPVSTRGSADDGGMGNQIAAVLVDLPVGPMDPARRLLFVAEAMGALKRHGGADAAAKLIQLSSLLPAPLHTAATRAVAERQWLYNLVVSNVPGVQFPLYCAGHRIREMYPLLPLTPNSGVTICVLSYDNQLNFGLVGDAAGVPDLHVLRRGIDDGFTRLREACIVGAKGRVAV